MSDLSELEQRKRELELKRDIRRLERDVTVNDAVATAKEKAPGVGRSVLKWVSVAFLVLVALGILAILMDAPVRG